MIYKSAKDARGNENMETDETNAQNTHGNMFVALYL